MSHQPDAGLIRVLLVEDSRVDVLLFKEAAAKAEDCRLTVDPVQSLGAAIEHLRREQYDVILLDLMLPDSMGLDTVIRTHARAPGVPIIVLTGVDDEAVALSAVQNGAHDYLVKGQFAPKQVLRAIRYAVARYQSRVGASRVAEADGAGRIVALSGGKGGSGTTVIACHLAVELQSCTGKRVLLLDLDLSSGTIPFIMKVAPTYSVTDAIEGVDRLDESFWKALVVNGKHKIDILAGTTRLDLDQNCTTPAVMRTLFTFLRRQYDWVIADMGKWPPSYCSGGLSEFDQLFSITSPDLMALYRTKQVIRSLSDTDFAPNRLGLVLNRMARHPELPAKNIENLLGLAVYAVVPETADIAEALAAGTLVAKGTDFTKAIEGFARRLAGIEEPHMPERRTFQLFGF